MSPSNEPSGRSRMALADPAIFAVVVNSSTRRVGCHLVRMVTSAPCMLVIRKMAVSAAGLVLCFDTHRDDDGVDTLHLEPRIVDHGRLERFVG